MFDTERLCLGCMNDNGGEVVCPVCGYDSTTANPEYALPAKFILNNRFFVGKLLSMDGEAITYIGWDKDEAAIVNIKEYFPKGFAHRNPDKTISIIPGGEYTFNEGLLEFAEINKTIMNSELPSLVPVVSVFEENGTMYAVSSNIPGITLASFLEKNGGSLKWEQARALFLPLIDTIKGMNDIGIYHRAISPETILVGRDGKLRISGYSIKNFRTQGSGLETQLFDGYSAVELYGFEDMHVGAYTDVYSLCATIFKVLIGVAPPKADLRLQNDIMSIPAKYAEELPRQVLAALANGLQVLPNERTLNIEKFKNELVYGEISQPSQKRRKANTEQPDNTHAKKKKGSSAAKSAIIASVCTALVFLIVAGVLIFTVFKEDVFGGDEVESSSDETIVSAPEVDQIGDIESGAEVTAKQYVVPDFKGQTYAEIIENNDYEMFDITISDKSFSSDYEKGTVCAQSVEPKTNVVRDTKIELVISLGESEVEIAKVTGYDLTTAQLTLLKQGFLYENIIVEERYGKDFEPGEITAQEPAFGEKVSVDEKVIIYINPAESEDDEETNSETSESSPEETSSAQN